MVGLFSASLTGASGLGATEILGAREFVPAVIDDVVTRQDRYNYGT
jgi:hypothetical protein